MLASFLKDVWPFYNIMRERVNYFYENSGRYLGTSTTDSNKHHSKPAAENESNDEGKEAVADIICNIFLPEKPPEAEVDKFSDNPLEYQYLS